MGSNASGKTTLGKAIRDIFYSIALKQFDGLGNAISDKNKVGKLQSFNKLRPFQSLRGLFSFRQ